MATSADRVVIMANVCHVFRAFQSFADVEELHQAAHVTKERRNYLVVVVSAARLSTVVAMNAASIVAQGRKRPVSVKLQSANIVHSTLALRMRI